MISARTIAIGLALFSTLSAGCAHIGALGGSIGRFSERRLHVQEEKIQLAEERHQLRMSTRDAELQQLRSETQQLRRGMAPEVESKLSTHLTQKYVVGPPELDVERLRSQLNALEEGRTEALKQYEDDLKAFRKRESEYYRSQEKETAQLVANGEVGCKIPCVEPFREAPPAPPRESMLAQQIPLVMRVNLLTGSAGAEIEEVRSEQVPVKAVCGDCGKPCNRCPKGGPNCCSSCKSKKPGGQAPSPQGDVKPVSQAPLPPPPTADQQAYYDFPAGQPTPSFAELPTPIPAVAPAVRPATFRIVTP